MQALFLDIETTGLSPVHHSVIQIAFKLLDLETYKELDTYDSIVFQPFEKWEKRDPLSSEINGFTWDLVEKGKPQDLVSLEIQAFFDKWGIQRGKTLFICQNPAFDRSFFAQIVPPEVQEQKKWPYHWLDLASMYWILQVHTLGHDKAFPSHINLSKNAIAAFYGLPPESNPHKAINGVNHLILCYKAIANLEMVK